MQKRLFIFLSFFLIVGISNCSGGLKDSQKQNPPVNSNQLSDDSLLTKVQYQTFQYFWEGAEPVSGLARERFHTDNVYPENDKNIITTGGSGFGFMAILIGIE